MEPGGIERSARLPVRMVVKVVLAGQAFRGELISLSCTEGFLETGTPLPEGTRLQLHLPVPGGQPLAVEATVTREASCLKPLATPQVACLVVRTTGVGLRFAPLEPDSALRLQSFLDRVADRL